MPTDPGVLIRSFSRADQRAARALILAGLGERFGRIDESLNPDLDDIGRAYLDAGHLFFVAERGGRLVGTCGLRDEPGGAARVLRMSVARSERRRGVASALLNACVDAARARGRAELRVATEPHWEEAVRFYLARGFRRRGADAVDVQLALPLAEAAR